MELANDECAPCVPESFSEIDIPTPSCDMKEEEDDAPRRRKESEKEEREREPAKEKKKKMSKKEVSKKREMKADYDVLPSMPSAPMDSRRLRSESLDYFVCDETIIDDSPLTPPQSPRKDKEREIVAPRECMCLTISFT
jgi:hypothetical protein